MKSFFQSLFNKSSNILLSATPGVAALMLLASAPMAAAQQTYDFTFTGGTVTASGWITVFNGVAQTGWITATGIPTEANPAVFVSMSGSLVPNPSAPAAISVRNHDGDDIIFDNVVNVGSDPALTGNGLGFASGQYAPGYYNQLLNIWGNSPGSYSLFAAEANLDGQGNVIGDPQYVYSIMNGSFTLTPVPEPSTLTLMLGALAVGRATLRRRSAS
ncbi:MAG: PEP-CTERM sorting domain-containing protein [Verrucomicrobiota bacterium]